MGVLAGVIKDAVSNVGLFNGNAAITGTFTTEPCDSNGVWVWGLHTGTVVIPGQSLTFSAYGHISQTQTIPSPGSDGNVWMVAALQREEITTSSCFRGDVFILMEDGSQRPISQIKVGDFVIGKEGAINQVLGIETPVLGRRPLYSINGSKAFVTAEHPFSCESGWHSIDPGATLLENCSLKVQPLTQGKRIFKFSSINEFNDQELNDVMLAQKTGLITRLETVKNIVPVTEDPNTVVFNLLLTGNNTYFANGYLVHNKGDH